MVGHSAYMNQIRASYATRIEGCKLFTMQKLSKIAVSWKKDCLKMKVDAKNQNKVGFGTACCKSWVWGYYI